MMLPAPRIIAIDDEPEHLEGLTRGLNRYGAACLPIHFTGELAAIPSCPCVRVIFADLHLTVGPPGKHDQHFATLGGLIDYTIKPSGPYLIVLWTRYPDQAARLHGYLKERLQHAPKPFAVQALDKSDHLDPQDVEKSAESIVGAIERIVAEQPQVGALLNWEERVLGAAADAVSSIMDLTDPAPADVNQNEGVGRLLAGLAAAAVGKEHVKEDRFRAVSDALLPILADRIASMRSRGNDTDLWQAAFEEADIEHGLTLNKAAKLNRLLHIAPPTDVNKWSERGAVIALPQRFSGSKFKRTFGLTQEATANKQFGAKGFETDDGRFRWVLVQSQAACDYAQMRQGPLPFHLGLCLPAPNARSSGHPAALWTSPCFEFDNEARFLHVNAGFQVSISPMAKVVEKPLFRLRDQLLNELIYRLHSHGARPGFISFRGAKKKKEVARG